MSAINDVPPFFTAQSFFLTCEVFGDTKHSRAEMELERATKYRIYPTKEQEKTLLRWEGSLRWLWNTALEQRFIYLGQSRRQRRDLKKYVASALSGYGLSDLMSSAKGTGSSFLFPHNSPCMSRQLTELRNDPDLPFGGVPRNAMVLTIFALDRAFVHWHSPQVEKQKKDFIRQLKEGTLPKKKRKRRIQDIGKPKFKGRRRSINIGQFGAANFSLGDGFIRVYSSRLGNLKAVLHREPPFRTAKDRLRRCVISRQGNQWFASVSYVLHVADPKKRVSPAVGIDRGVKFILADSVGRCTPRPPVLASLEKRIRSAQRKVSKKKKFSQNWKKANIKVDRIKATKSRIVEDLLHKESLYYAEKYGTVVLEDLSIGNMTKSAKKSEESPGKQVKQKAGLNRVILESGWGKFKSMLEYKLAERGGKLIEVPPQYTSQRCSVCGYIHEDNRTSRDWFCCVECGHQDHADVNAAKNLIYKAGFPKTNEVKEWLASDFAGDQPVTAYGGESLDSPVK